MYNSTTLAILTILLPLIGGGVGFLIKQQIEKRKALVSEISRERRELYQKFVDLIIDLFGDSKTGKQKPEKQLINKLYEFYKKYVLYASPGVIKSYSDYFQFLYKHQGNTEKDLKEHFLKLSRILVEMRKDLGLKNSYLGKDGEILFRALLTDFDKMF